MTRIKDHPTVAFLWTTETVYPAQPGWVVWTDMGDGGRGEPAAVAAWLAQAGKPYAADTGAWLSDGDARERRIVPGIVCDGQLMAPDEADDRPHFVAEPDWSPAEPMPAAGGHGW
jgi:hypothetical protein